MGKKKNFAGATAPPSHYVAPPLSGEWMSLAEMVELCFGIYETGDEVVIKNLNIACVYVPFS